MAVRPSAAGAGKPGNLTYAGFTDHSPTATRTISGSSFATVAVSTRNAPNLTPRTFTAATTPISTTSSMARPAGVAAGAQTAATEPANALATEATANAAISWNRKTAGKSKKGPA